MSNDFSCNIIKNIVTYIQINYLTDNLVQTKN